MTEKRVKLLYISFTGRLERGGQQSLYYLLKGLDKTTFQPFLIVPEEGSFAEVVRKVSIKVFVVTFSGLRRLNLFAVARTIRELFRMIKSVRPSVIHTDSPREAIYAGIAARWFKIPMIFHARVSSSEWFLDRMISLFAERIIVVSEGIINRFSWLKKTPQRIVTVHNAVDIERFKPRSNSDDFRYEIDVSEETTLLGVVGDIIPNKGQEALIQAVHDIKEYVSDIKLVVVGTGEEGYLQELATLTRKLDITDSVRFLKFRKDIEKVFSAIDIFVLPTRSEGFSRVILEAMSSGKAVVATNISGNREAIVHGETGILVPLDDPGALRRAIVELCSDPAGRIEMGRKGRMRVEQHFRIESNVRKIEKIYLDLIKDGTASVISGKAQQGEFIE